MAVINLSVSDSLAFAEVQDEGKSEKVSDTLTYTDSGTFIQNPRRFSNSDSIIFTDSLAQRSKIYFRLLITDSISFVEVLKNSGTLRPPLASDLIVFSDFLGLDATPKRLSVIDTLTFTEIIKRGGTNRQPVSDSITFTDSGTGQSRRFIIQDFITLTDSGVSRFGIHNLATIDGLILIDSNTVRNTTNRLVDFLGLFDFGSVVKYQSILHDTIAFVDFAQGIKAREILSILDSMVLSDSVIVHASKIVSDFLYLNDATCVIGTYGLLIPDSIGFIDSGILKFAGNDPRNNPLPTPTPAPTPGFGFSGTYFMYQYDILEFKETIGGTKNGVDINLEPYCAS